LVQSQHFPSKMHLKSLRKFREAIWFILLQENEGGEREKQVLLLFFQRTSSNISIIFHYCQIPWRTTPVKEQFHLSIQSVVDVWPMTSLKKWPADDILLRNNLCLTDIFLSVTFLLCVSRIWTIQAKLDLTIWFGLKSIFTTESTASKN